MQNFRQQTLGLTMGPAGRRTEAAEEAAWYDILGRFKQAAERFQAARLELLNGPTPIDPSLRDERARLLSQFNAVEAQVRGVRDSLASALSTIGSGFGWLQNLLGDQDAQLGVLPAIPVAFAVVSGSSAAMTVCVTSYARYAQRLSVYNDARAAGSTPEQASLIVERVESGGGFSIWKPGQLPWTAIAVGVGAVAFLAMMRRR